MTWERVSVGRALQAKGIDLEELLERAREQRGDMI
jgi:hypothetical protein